MQEGRCRLEQTVHLPNFSTSPAIYLTNPSAGELTTEELERIVTIIQNPTQYKIPTWFLNRQRDIVDGKDSQILANALDNKMREDLERLKKIRAHRGLRHYWGLRVRGQHTKTTGELRSTLWLKDNLLIWGYRSSRSYRRCIKEEGLNGARRFFFSFCWRGMGGRISSTRMLVVFVV